MTDGKPTHYKVGYGKPPAGTQFKPGKSGNPSGRPPGAKNKRSALNNDRLKSIITDEAYREITVRDGERNVSEPMAQAIIRSLAVNAAKGQHRSQRLFAELLSATENHNRTQSDELLKTAIEYKLDWEKELERRAAEGITHLSAPLPHPDHVVIDVNTGSVHIAGPMTKKDKAEIDDVQRLRNNWAKDLELALKDLETEEDEGIRKILKGDVAFARKFLARVDPLLEILTSGG